MFKTFVIILLAHICQEEKIAQIVICKRAPFSVEKGADNKNRVISKYCITWK